MLTANIITHLWLRRKNVRTPESVWPDLAKIRICKILIYFWQIYDAIGQIFIDVNGQKLSN